jgi:tetratricopeptide (TPR) repeat protein
MTAPDLHRLGVAATAGGDPATGSRYLHAGLRLVGWPGQVHEPVMAGRLLISLAHAEAELGRVESGLELLSAAVAFVPQEDRGVLAQQHGLLLLRAGRLDSALSYLDEAVPLLEAGDRRDVLARTLLNRAVLYQSHGRIEAARSDLRRCAVLAHAEGSHQLAAKAEHNLGYCDFLVGDIPAALRAFAAAEQSLAGVPGLIAIVATDRARALISAGLIRDAQRDLDHAVRLFAQQQLRQDQAEAELIRAQAALAADDAPTALLWSARARRRLLRRGNTSGAALAELTHLRAQFHADPHRRGLFARARVVAKTLYGAGLRDDGDLASLVALRVSAAVHTHRNHSGAAQHVQSPARWPHDPRPREDAPLEVRLTYRLAHAELAIREGDHPRAIRHAHAGLAALQEHRGRFGSLDLQTGTLASGAQLANLGTDLVWRAGSARDLYEWSERCRAQAFRVRPVRPTVEGPVVEALAELRHAQHTVRATALAGKESHHATRARIAELQRQIRQHDWQSRGSRHSDEVAPLDQVTDELAEIPAALVSFIHRSGRLGALTITPSGAKRVDMVDLGPLDRLSEIVTRLRSDIDVLASRRLPVALQAAVQASIQEHTAALERELLGGLTATLHEHQRLVVVPTSALSTLPWGCLPALRDRPVCVWRLPRPPGCAPGAPRAPPGPAMCSSSRVRTSTTPTPKSTTSRPAMSIRSCCGEPAPPST